jgi:DNA uptake protein ComE-like DNA-binding protein
VELNSAARKRLGQLPGLTGDDANRIIANRPYEKRRDLVRKGVLSESKFDKIRDDVYVDHEKN